MKLITLFAFIFVFAAAVVSAVPATNADRLARGLPPLAPAKRATGVAAAKRSGPSPVPGCSTGTLKCCNHVGTKSQLHGLGGLIQLVLDLLLGTVTGLLGAECSLLSLGGSCSAQTVCCTGNEISGLITIGCSPINIL